MAIRLAAGRSSSMSSCACASERPRPCVETQSSRSSLSATAIPSRSTSSGDIGGRLAAAAAAVASGDESASSSERDEDACSAGKRSSLARRPDRRALAAGSISRWPSLLPSRRELPSAAMPGRYRGGAAMLALALSCMVLC